MIGTDHLSFGYGGTPVLKDLTVEIREGAITSLLGANGCGKSTLLKLMTKNLKPDRGQVTLRGHDVERISLREFARQVAIVHQNNRAPDDVTVERLVSYGRLPYTSVFRLSLDPESRKQVYHALELTDLTDLRDRPLGSLSGGQRQRAFIAMALAQNTEILFLDEPTTFLDVRYQVEVLQLVRRLNREQGMTIVMVLHDINQALSYSDELIGLKDGGVAFQGRPEDVVNSESIEDLYGIRLPVVRAGSRVFVPAVAEDLRNGAAEENVSFVSKTGKTTDAGKSGSSGMDDPEIPEKERDPFVNDNRNQEFEMKAEQQLKVKENRFVRGVFIILGILCAGLGAIGVALPVLPTTPFLLAAAFCFAKSSERLNTWFRGTHLYRSHLETFNRGEGMTRAAKFRIIATVTAVMAVAEGFMIRAVIVKGSHGALIGCITMAAVWIAHLIVFCFVIKTCSPERAVEIARMREMEDLAGNVDSSLPDWESERMRKKNSGIEFNDIDGETVDKESPVRKDGDIL